MLAIETCVNVLLSWKKLNRFRLTIYREQSRFSGTLPKGSCFLKFKSFIRSIITNLYKVCEP
jgi:hypothetical protein